MIYFGLYLNLLSALSDDLKKKKGKKREVVEHADGEDESARKTLNVEGG